MVTSLKAYYRLIRSIDGNASGLSGRKAARATRSAARSVLPEGTDTKIVVTANARAIRHFLNVRGGLEDDEEMRLVIAHSLKEVSKDAPSIFANFEAGEMPDGSPVVRKTS